LTGLLRADVEKECFVHFRNGISMETQQSVENKYRLTEIRSFLLTRARLYAISDGNASTVIPNLRREPSVKFADFNRRHSLQSISLNEPRLNDQWYLKNRGQTVNNQSGKTGADVEWVSALNQYVPRKKRVVVSVIDTGISADHPELTDQLAYMPAEVSGADGIDDDGLGLLMINTDGILLIMTTTRPTSTGTVPRWRESLPLIRVIRLGMSGVAPNAVILPMRVFNEYGGGATDDRVLSALGYSISGGVRIINLSLGKGSAFSYPIQDALYNLERDYDVLMVCAAGNGDYYGRGMNLDQSAFYPASYLGNAILSVASTDQNNELSPFSNYGKTSVDLAAPGSNMLVPDLSRKRSYFENFERGLSGWTVTGSSNSLGKPWQTFDDDRGNRWITDSAYDSSGGLLNYTLNTESYLTSPVIDLARMKSPSLGVRIYHNLARNFFLFSYDLLHIEVAVEGSPSWESVGRIYGQSMRGGSYYQFDLSRMEGKRVRIRFRLATDNYRNADGVYLDDFEISGVSSFNGGNEEYTFVNGTSFAAPMVSGVAALLLAQRPELSVSEVRAILLQSATPIAGLKDRVVSGGILNARGALELTDRQKIFPRRGLALS
jgi:subtilisin family serine protease